MSTTTLPTLSQPAKGGRAIAPLWQTQKIMENIIILAQGFTKILLTFAPFAVVGAVAMAITTRK
jgi:hypothetical protein